MKLLCISNKMASTGNNDYYINIIPGKYYECEPWGICHFFVKDESGEGRLYLYSNFEMIEETRNKKLNDLGI